MKNPRLAAWSKSTNMFAWVKITHNLKYRFKEDRPLLMVIASYLAFFNKNFMTRYVTTVRNTIYWVSRKRMRESTLFHELQHVMDSRWLTYPLFGFLYTFPNNCAIFSLLTILAIWNPWHWLWLLTLPLVLCPSPGRTWAELRGYALSMYVKYQQDGRLSEEYINFLVQVFTGPDYLFMWPFKNDIRKRINKLVHLIETDRLELPAVKVWKNYQSQNR